MIWKESYPVLDPLVFHTRFLNNHLKTYFSFHKAPRRMYESYEILEDPNIEMVQQTCLSPLYIFHLRRELKASAHQKKSSANKEVHDIFILL